MLSVGWSYMNPEARIKVGGGVSYPRRELRVGVAIGAALGGWLFLGDWRGRLGVGALLCGRAAGTAFFPPPALCLSSQGRDRMLLPRSG